jgi:acyl-CoA synthetase (AMP-forming)/AMP-acid ligase II
MTHAARPPDSMADLMARQAAAHGARTAFVFVPERGDARPALTFAELDRRARALAARLLRRAAPGDRAVLLFPPGLDFVVAFHGCLAAGLVAVPLMPPRRAAVGDASAAILSDCVPRLALTSAEFAGARPDLLTRFGAGLVWEMVDAAQEFSDAGSSLPARRRDDLAFLQYTSGSTSTPKGVMVGHGNLLANLEMIRAAMSNTADSTSVGWVPVYHDMGLMMGVMQPMYVGALSVMMAPAAFMQRPLNWLRAISTFGARVTSAPNFAFDLCVDRCRPELMDGIDLSCLKIALNGAEPLKADTVARFTETFAPYGFAPGAMYPGYGLAEATLLVTGGTRGEGASTRRVSRAGLQQGVARAPEGDADAQDSVACGRVLEGERIAIVDPDRFVALAAGVVGEIWVSGAHVTQGYWRNEPASAAAFPVAALGGGDAERWLRTGDLGFLDADGALHVTGRIKDLIIIRGVNHYPQDIERTMQTAHPALRRDWGAAFSVPDAHGVERLVVVQEVERTQRHDLDVDEILARIREAVATEHEVAIHAIALIRPASLPKTTSGKVQRARTRQLWLDGALDLA